MRNQLEKLLSEVRRDLGTAEAKAVDWEAVDGALFARLEQERRAERARLAAPKRRGTGLAFAALASAAIVAAVVIGKMHDPGGSDRAAEVETAGTVVSIDGSGGLTIDGARVSSGAALKLGDVVETGPTVATIERPGKLEMTLEPATRTVVTHVRGALIVSLEQGAVEAQVTPVASGEAFAVDVEHARVAVHGTHLRVARDGDRVIVDLYDGVISVGEAPRIGSVEGALVNAPAHVEFMAADPRATLTQTHDPAAVREAHARTGAMAAPKGLFRPYEPNSGSHHGAASAPDTRAEARAPSSVSGKPLASAAPSLELTPTEAIANAVRACMAARPRADNVTVVVSTTLRLDVADDGSIRTARFEPPVAPDVNACAVPSIYKQRFDHGGPISIPIDFTN